MGGNNQVFPDLNFNVLHVKTVVAALIATNKHTYMSIIQESQGLGNVVQSENAVRGRPKPIELT